MNGFNCLLYLDTADITILANELFVYYYGRELVMCTRE